MGAAAVWVTSGPGMPCGARRLDADPKGKRGEDMVWLARPGTVWVDVCVLGQHLPQMYKTAEIRELTADGCARLGLCDHCLGFGDLGPQPDNILALARGVDQVSQPCPGCGGTGRPALRITVRRDARGTSADIRPLPHAYVRAPDDVSTADPDLLALFRAPSDACLACGMPPDGTGPRGEALHP